MSRKLLAILYFLTYLIFPVLVLSPSVTATTGIAARLVIFALLVCMGALIFTRTWPSEGWGKAFLLTFLGYGVAYKLASYIPDVSSYPFTLGWSEGSRYYYASLWFSRQLYGITIPPSVLHPTRYLLQGIPFLVSGVSLWFSRFWQVLLWVGTTALTTYLLLRRLGLARQRNLIVAALSFLAWGFLFILQAPIYYHLQVMLILILWGFNKNHPWRNLVLVLIASLWAGISRVNWLPVPGMLAASLYLLEVEAVGKRLWRYLLPPAGWALAGTIIGFTSQRLYQAFSGNPQAWFGSSFTSDLLWYRLLPNPTYPMGILISAALVSIPILGLIGIRLVPHWREYHIIRLLGLTAIIGVMFAGGVIVSVKIGGGSNLHNLDAYLALLLVIGSYIYFDRFVPDHPILVEAGEISQPAQPGPVARVLETVLLLGVLVIPLYFTISYGGKLPRHDFQAAQADLDTLNTSTQQVAQKSQPVLFISQRHLLTFNKVQGVPLVPDYELVFLMEMAMSNNRTYLDAFQQAISSQRYGMIVSEPLSVQYQGKSHIFGEENDAWVKNVAEPILCYYEPAVKLDVANVILYTPRLTPCK